jgi:acetylornithine deacetylase
VDPVSILRRLVAIDSTSSRSNRPLVDLLEEVVLPLGFEARRIEWRDPEGVEKLNLVCRRGPDVAGGLALVGHTDCVPFDPQWEEALSGEVRDDKVFGRGAATPRASSRRRFPRLPRRGRWRPAPPRVHRTGIVPQRQGALSEGGSRCGTPSWASPPRSPPSARGDAARRAVTGVKHAFPTWSVAHPCGELVTEVVDRIQEELKDEQDPDFSPPWTTFNVGVIHGGKARNILAGECTFTLEWRPLPGQDPERALRLLDAACERAEAAQGGRIAIRRTPMQWRGGQRRPTPASWPGSGERPGRGDGRLRDGAAGAPRHGRRGVRLRAGRHPGGPPHGRVRRGGAARALRPHPGARHRAVLRAAGLK